jgi:hypothetical protein
MFERKQANLIFNKAYFAVVAGSYDEKYNEGKNKICRLQANDGSLKILLNIVRPSLGRWVPI